MTTTRTRTLTAIAVLVATVVAAGCGGGGGGGSAQVASLGTASEASAPDPSGSTDDSSPPVDPDEAMLAYTECMREHGVDLPDPRPVGDGQDAVVALEVDPSSDEFQEAQEACEPIMEEAMGDLEIDPEREAEIREELLAYTECMREQGIDMPDPVFSDGGRVEVEVGSSAEPGRAPEVAPDSDEFRAAEEACADERPGGMFVTSDTIEGS